MIIDRDLMRSLEQTHQRFFETCGEFNNQEIKIKLVESKLLNPLNVASPEIIQEREHPW